MVPGSGDLAVGRGGGDELAFPSRGDAPLSTGLSLFPGDYAIFFEKKDLVCQPEPHIGGASGAETPTHPRLVIAVKFLLYEISKVATSFDLLAPWPVGWCCIRSC